MSKHTQWHPLFAHLLRPVVEDYYDVQTNVPVGDVPREADLVLLRRKTAGVPPFRGIWTDLTTWSILEFKSPRVTPERSKQWAAPPRKSLNSTLKGFWITSASTG